ncbi:hypothetical protein Golomagni_06524, partial [Golovinomyces magnicellulatus]
SSQEHQPEPEKVEPEKASTELSPAPDGGLRAWTIAVGGASVFFCTLGFANSFGTFEQYYITHQLQGESASKVSWIGSLAAFLQFLTGLVSGPCFDRFGAKMLRPAALLYVFAVMMLSICKVYWHFMLVQGVLMGILMGVLQMPAFASVSQYFDKKRAAAMGVVVSGSSIGGIVIPLVLSKLLNDSSVGFGWSVRIIGFIMLPFIIFACVGIKERLPPRKSQFWLFSALKDRLFIAITVAMFFMFFGMFVPAFYLPSYAASQGMKAALAGYLLSIFNAASTFGRVIPGVLADKYGKLNMLGAGGIATGVIIFCMSSVTNNVGLILYAVFVGFASGTLSSGGAAALSICPKDPRDLGTYIGMGLALSCVGGLIGPPINGAFIHAYGGYFEACVFSGTLCTFGGIVALLAKHFSDQGLFGKV